MKKLLIAVMALVATSAARAEDLSGDWQGALHTAGGDLRLVLHVAKADGAYQASLDSLDQGASGIPVSALTFSGGTVSLQVPAVRGSFEGKLDAKGSEIAGTWTQGGSLPLVFRRLPKSAAAAPPAASPAAPATTAGAVAATSPPAKPVDIAGTWLGTIDAGALKLRVAFHITSAAEGLKATMDSLDQNAKGIPVTKVSRDGTALVLELTPMAATFQGEIARDGSAIRGTWTQSGAAMPLVVRRVKDPAAALALARPQEPKKPYPYAEEEVAYDNPAAEVRLAGTLTVPSGKGPFPAALLITGSGPQDRDESIMGHRPFLVLADHLTRKGIAVLRVDDRGVGKSGGKFAIATTADFATDAEAGIAFLKTRPEVDPKRIGLIGHSEGGVIAPMIASRSRDVAFIVLLAGTGVPGVEVLVEQVRSIDEVSGMSPEGVKGAVDLERQLLALVMKVKDDVELDRQVREVVAGRIPEGQITTQLGLLKSPWFRYFLAHDPAPALRKVRCPVLALGGSKDTQVSANQNLPAIRRALEEGKNGRFEVTELPGLNHLLQTAKTGAPAEYAEIDETMSPAAMEKIASWIGSLWKKP